MKQQIIKVRRYVTPFSSSARTNCINNWPEPCEQQSELRLDWVAFLWRIDRKCHIKRRRLVFFLVNRYMQVADEAAQLP